MNLGILILKDEDLLDEVLTDLKKSNYKNITFLNSYTYNLEEGNKNIGIIASIRKIVDFYKEESRIVLIEVPSSKIDNLKEVIKKSLSFNQYSFYTIKIDNYKGFDDDGTL